ncbi:tripartite tricarboxylate transporter substrate-binding protein [Bradyrhizobium sp. URHC0002]
MLYRNALQEELAVAYVIPKIAARIAILPVLVVSLLLGAPTPTMSQNVTGPIRLFVGYPAGGPADVGARLIAEGLARELKRAIIVENKSGAGGQLAALAVKSAPADGSVLFLSNLHAMATIPLTIKEPGFSPSHDFKMIGAVATFELALAVHPKTQSSSLSEFAAWLVANRSVANVGVPASGSAPEFVINKIARTLNAEATPVPYRGAAPMVQDLLGGQIAAALSSISDFLPYHEANTLRIVAVSQTTPLLPDVPSFTQAGIWGLDGTTDFLGLYAPAATSADIVERYNAALKTVLALPEVRAGFAKLVMTPAPGTPNEHRLRLERASEILSKLIQESGYTPQ